MNLLNVENLRSFREKTSGLRADTPTKGRGLFFFFPEPGFVGFKMGTLFLSSDNAVGSPEEATPRDSAAQGQVPSALSTSQASRVGWGVWTLPQGLPVPLLQEDMGWHGRPCPSNGK